MIKIIQPTDEQLALLASDKTEAITLDELKTMPLVVAEIDGKTLIAMLRKSNELWIVAIHGGRIDWKPVTDWLDDVCKAAGCKAVRFMGRSGWKRRLAKLGYKQVGIIMKREVIS